MSYQQIFSQSNLEQLFRERLFEAIEEAKLSVLSPSNNTVNKDQLYQKFGVSPVEFFDEEMTASGAMVNKNDQIEIEFRVPFIGDPLLTLHQSAETQHQKLPKAFYIPADPDTGDAHDQEKQWISFLIVDDHGTKTEAFIGQAKLELGKLKSVLQTNNRLAEQLNKSQMPSAVERAMVFCETAVQRLEEVNEQLQNSQK